MKLMENKRDFKKYVHHMCGAIAGECVLAIGCVEGADVVALNQVLVALCDLQEHTLSAASMSFDKAPRDFESGREYRRQRSAYYRKAYEKLQKEFLEALNNLVSQLNHALPELKAE